MYRILQDLGRLSHWMGVTLNGRRSIERTPAKKPLQVFKECLVASEPYV